MKSHIRLLLRQARFDFRRRYLGTLFGIAWAFISPLMNIALIYVVFTFGLKAGHLGDGIPFLDWFVPGMVAWLFMSEAIGAGCGAVMENTHLATKVVFPLRLLPPAKILTIAPVHFALMTLPLAIVLIRGSGTPMWWWQIAYYFLCAFIFCTAAAFITSACMVFVRDTANVIQVLLQVFFWATPIFWDPAMAAGTRGRFLLYSPINYIVQGYRDSILYARPFWEKPMETAVFWVFTLLLAGAGLLIFKRARPHFADVL